MSLRKKNPLLHTKLLSALLVLALLTATLAVPSDRDASAAETQTLAVTDEALFETGYVDGRGHLASRAFGRCSASSRDSRALRR